MTNLNKTGAVLAISAAAAMACPAGAIAQDSGWYAGASVGKAYASVDDARIRHGVQAQGLALLPLAERERDTGYKLFAGYRFHRNVAVEAGFFDAGRFGYRATTTPAGTLTGDVRVRGMNVDLVGILPVTERLSLEGRVGAASARARGSFAATGDVKMPYPAAHTSAHETNAKFGLGATYELTPSLAMRVEAERLGIDDSVANRGGVTMVSVGLVYRFGSAPTAPAVRASVAPPAPAPAAPPPSPAPVEPPAPAPAPRAEVAPPPPPALPPPPKPYRN